MAGSAINWLKSIGILKASSEVDGLAASVADSGGLAFVPAFNGLFAPHWRPDARGMMIGITQYTSQAHIVRATLEAVAFQTYELLEAMQQESPVYPVHYTVLVVAVVVVRLFCAHLPLSAE